MQDEVKNVASVDTTERLVHIIKDMTSDWDVEVDNELDENTRLIEDLEFESVDIVQLVVAIEEGFGKRNIPFEQLLMVDGRYVDDLTIGQVVEFLAQHT